MKNNFKYKLISHPFKFFFTSEEIEAIYNFYENLISINDIELLFKAHSFFTNLQSSSKNKLKFPFFKQYNKTIVKSCLNSIKNNTPLEIEYLTSSAQKLKIIILPDRIEMKNDKIYVYGKTDLYKDLTCLDIKKITKLVVLQQSETLKNYESNFAEIEVFRNLEELNTIFDKMKILKRTKNSTYVTTSYKNEFELIQKLMQAGKNCKLVKPESVKENLITTLKCIQSRY